MFSVIYCLISSRISEYIYIWEFIWSYIKENTFFKCFCNTFNEFFNQLLLIWLYYYIFGYTLYIIFNVSWNNFTIIFIISLNSFWWNQHQQHNQGVALYVLFFHNIQILAIINLLLNFFVKMVFDVCFCLFLFLYI